MNYGTDVPLRATVSVLKSWVQGTTKRTGVHTLSVVMHTLYYRTLPASCIFLRGELLEFLRQVTGCLGQRPGVEGGGLLLDQRRGGALRAGLPVHADAPGGVHAVAGVLAVVVGGAELFPRRGDVVGHRFRAADGGVLLQVVDSGRGGWLGGV